MNPLNIGHEFYKAVAENNSAIVEEGVNEIQDKLFVLWNNSRDSRFEDFLDLGFQRLKRSRRDIPNWRENTVYQIGMLDGILSTFERLLQEAKDRNAIDQSVKQTLRNSGPVAKKIFSKLFSLSEEDEWIGHKELALSVETSDSSLSNIMKRLVISRAVESERIGKNVNYRITSAGKRYYLETITKHHPEEMLDSVLAGFSELSQKIDKLSAQVVNISQTSKEEFYGIMPDSNVSIQDKQSFVGSKIENIEYAPILNLYLQSNTLHAVN